MALVASDDQRAVLDQVSGLMSLLEGHGDVTMDRAGEGLIPSAERFSRVLRQRRQSAQGLARLLQQIIGLEAKLAQYEQGERFIETVEASDPRVLDMAWERPENLPSIAEIRDPSAWLARVAAARVA
jgi:putative hydrolase